MPNLKNCSYGTSLNKGGLILGIIALAWSIIEAVSTIGLLVGALQPNNNPGETVSWPLMGFLIALCIVSLITSSLLIFAAVRVRRMTVNFPTVPNCGQILCKWVISNPFLSPTASPKLCDSLSGVVWHQLHMECGGHLSGELLFH